MHLDGLHHVSAITSAGAECADFYGLLLGLDRVPSKSGDSSRLAFGDSGGACGGAIGFTEVAGAPSGKPGSGFVHRVLWRVQGPRALEFWKGRLELAGVAAEEVAGDAGLRFADPDGLEHELAVGGSADRPAASSTSIPRELRIRGLAGVRAHARSSVESSDLLAGRLEFRALAAGEWLVRGPRRQARYGCDAPPPGRAVQGAGTVTHVTWSCPPGELRAWRQRVIGMGATVSRIDGERPSFFFREPDGVLFSVAAEDAEATGPPLRRRRT